MNEVNSSTLEIINKIHSVDLLFSNASKRIGNSTVRQKMKEIQSVNRGFLKGLTEHSWQADFEEKSNSKEKHNPHNQMEDLNEKEILWLCLNNEEELVKLYQKAISCEELNNLEDKLYKRQLNRSLSHFNQLKMVNESLHYQN